MSWEVPYVCASVFVIVFAVAVFAWYMLHAISERRPQPENTRFMLVLIVAALSIVELHHVWTGRMCGWMAWATLVGNVWGFLDAALRFPSCRNVGTFFALKQCVLLSVKVACLSRGFEERSFENAMWFLVLLDLNIFFPLLYATALPDGDAVEQQLAANDVVNADLALRAMGWALGLATYQQRKQDSYSTQKGSIRLVAAGLAERSLLAEKAVTLRFRLPWSRCARRSRRVRCV